MDNQVRMAYKQQDILLHKIRSVDKRLKELENDAFIPNDIDFGDDITVSSRNVWCGQDLEQQETQEELHKCIRATEELLGISVLHYSATPLSPQEGLPAGRWNEITMNVVLLGTLKAAITIIEGRQNGSKNQRTLSLECALGGGPSSLSSYETASLLEACYSPPCPRLLLSSLKDYARLSLDRKNVLKAFRAKFQGYVDVQSSTDSIVALWKDGLFKLQWAVEWNQGSEKVMHNISVEIDNGNVRFIRSCESSLRQLTHPSTSPEEKLMALNEIGSMAQNC